MQEKEIIRVERYRVGVKDSKKDKYFGLVVEREIYMGLGV